jgi:hypothetical protein
LLLTEHLILFHLVKLFGCGLSAGKLRCPQKQRSHFESVSLAYIKDDFLRQFAKRNETSIAFRLVAHTILMVNADSVYRKKKWVDDMKFLLASDSVFSLT